MFDDVPLAALVVTVWAYWATVILLALYQRLRNGRSAGLLPRQRYERRLWRMIAPVVGAWLVLPALAGSSGLPGLRLPAWAVDMPWASDLRAAAAGLAVVWYALSVYSWLSLGRNWSMAIVPGQTSQLVTGGMYRWVRHPIYGLQVALMLTSVVVIPTVPMCLLASLHFLAMNLKARHEERHLAERFGPPYREYCHRVGRFWPRFGKPPVAAGTAGLPKRKAS